MPRPHPTDHNAEIHTISDDDGSWEATHHLGVGDGHFSPVDFTHVATQRALRGHVLGLGPVTDDEVLTALREAKRLSALSGDA